MIEILLEAERAMSVGLVDHAERLYRQAAESDPRNSIAVVGLARVALERGDGRGAWQLGRDALAIDPENDAARRLVSRLEEVWAYRGEAPPGQPGPPAEVPPPHSPAVVDADAAAPSPEPGRTEPRPPDRREPGLLRRLLGRD